MHAKLTYEELESLVDNSPDLILRVDSKLRHLYVNQAVLDTTGPSREQYLGKTNRDLGMPEHLCGLWDDVFLRVFETGQPQQAEFAFSGLQGRRYYQMRIVPEFDPHGVCKTAVGITRDITEQKRAEQEISDLARFPSDNPNPVFRVAKDGTVRYANEAALPLLTTRDGQRMQCVPDRWRQFVLDSLASGKCMFCEVECRDRVFSVAFSPVLDRGYVNGYGLDVTDLKSAYARLAEQAAMLETKVKERTKELNCLLSISKMANQQDASLDDVLGKIPNLLVSSWQYPEIACARVLFDDKEFESAGFQSGNWRQSAAIHVHGKKAGNVEVCYLQERPCCDEDPFLQEERRLLDAVALQIGTIVEQLQADQKIKQQWEQVMSILSSFADSIYVADPKTYEILYANKALQQVLGKNPVGGFCYKEFQGLDRPCEFCTNAIILEARRPYVWEYDNPLVEKSFLVTDQIIRWPDGRDVRFEVSMDITERKNGEKALRRTNEILEKILSTTFVLIAYMDTDFDFVWVNRSYAQSDGREPEFFIGKNHFDLYPNKDNERIFRRVVETGQPFEARAKPFEYPQQPERGTTYWDWTLQCVKTASGEAEGVLLCLQDVTEGIESERSLRESEERFRLMAETIEDVFWMSTPGVEKMLYVSPAYEKIWGHSRKSLYDSPRSFIDRVHPEDREKVLGAVEQHRRGQWSYEYRIVQPDGAIRWIEDRGYPIKDEHGNLRLMTGVASDITERKVKEDALRESERRIRALSRRLAEAQEIERKQISQDLHDSIGGKLSAIKYGVEKVIKEWKVDTPLEGISLQDVVEVVQDVIEETRRMSAGLSPLALDDLGILKTVEVSCRKFERLYPQVRIDPQLRVSEDDVPEGLSIIIYRVIQEALANAVKHSGAKLVSVGLQKRKNKIELVVQDDGKGLDMQDKHDRDDYASGMGLINMMERTELSGGSFEIASVEGKGTTIRAVWPIL